MAAENGWGLSLGGCCLPSGIVRYSFSFCCFFKGKKQIKSRKTDLFLLLCHSARSVCEKSLVLECKSEFIAGKTFNASALMVFT